MRQKVHNLQIGEIYSIEELIDEIGSYKLETMIKEGLIFKNGIGTYEYGG